MGLVCLFVPLSKTWSKERGGKHLTVSAKVLLTSICRLKSFPYCFHYLPPQNSSLLSGSSAGSGQQRLTQNRWGTEKAGVSTNPWRGKTYWPYAWSTQGSKGSAANSWVSCQAHRTLACSIVPAKRRLMLHNSDFHRTT